MCANPTGGHGKITGLTEELLRLLPANAPNEQVLWLATINDASNNYLLWGLGNNGTSAQEFSDACTYFFKTRSNDPETWVGKRRLREMCLDDKGRRYLREQTLTKEEMRLMTFDYAFKMAGLDKCISLPRFLERLIECRRVVVEGNKEQIDRYLQELRDREAARVGPGSQLQLRIYSYDQQSVLICPDNPRQVAELIYLPTKPRKTYTHSHSRSRQGPLKKAAAAA